MAGDLPATAPKEEKYEAIMKVTRAETRGLYRFFYSHKLREKQWESSISSHLFLEKVQLIVKYFLDTTYEIKTIDL